METTLIDIYKSHNILIGVKGENEVLQVLFDITAWRNKSNLEQTGTYILYLKYPNESKVNKLTLESENHFVKWTIQKQDLERVGKGEAQLFFEAINGQIIASNIFKIIVQDCM